MSVSPTDDEAEGAATDASAPETSDASRLDLDRVGADLDGVEAALRRLDDGSYWTDEVTGAEIPDEVLAADPVTRRSEP